MTTLKILVYILVYSSLFFLTFAAALTNIHNETDIWILSDDDKPVEWTSMGDSYASGIGSGKHITTGGIGDKFCFRFDEAYGPLLENDLEIPKFNYVACAGETFDKILKNQFVDKPIGPFYDKRQALWGKPGFVTISLGGNDIGFKELVTRCIYGIWFFTPGKTCDDVIKSSREKIANPDFQSGFIKVINKALEKGTDAVGPTFKVFVVGYAQFFNEQNPVCNDKQLLTPGYLNPHRHGTLTIELRQTLNELARALNAAIQTGIQGVDNPDQVVYIDYDAAFDTHRFCDRDEPNPTDPETWFITYKVKRGDLEKGEFLYSIPRIRDLEDDVSSKPLTEAEFIQLIGDAADVQSYTDLDVEVVVVGVEDVAGAHAEPVPDADGGVVLGDGVAVAAADLLC